MQNKKTSLGTNDIKIYFVMSDELKQEWNKVFYSLMKHVAGKNPKGMPYTKDEYHRVADSFNDWLVAIARYKDEKGKYSNYFEWLNNQAKGNILARRLMGMFIIDDNEKNYNIIVDKVEYIFDSIMEERILMLSTKYNEERDSYLSTEYRKQLDEFRQTDTYQQWAKEYYKHKKSKPDWLKEQ